LAASDKTHKESLKNVSAKIHPRLVDYLPVSRLPTKQLQYNDSRV